MFGKLPPLASDAHRNHEQRMPRVWKPGDDIDGAIQENEERPGALRF